MKRIVDNKEYDCCLIRVTELKEINELLDEFSKSLICLQGDVIFRQNLSRKLFEFGIVVKLVCDSSIIGFLAMYANDFNNKTAYISLIAVHEKYRGKGFGSQLLEISINLAKEHQMDSVKLEVAKNNTIALKCYKKNGFVILDDASENSFYMMKKI